MYNVGIFDFPIGGWVIWMEFNDGVFFGSDTRMNNFWA